MQIEWAGLIPNGRCVIIYFNSILDVLLELIISRVFFCLGHIISYLITTDNTQDHTQTDNPAKHRAHPFKVGKKQNQLKIIPISHEIQGAVQTASTPYPIEIIRLGAGGI